LLDEFYLDALSEHLLLGVERGRRSHGHLRNESLGCNGVVVDDELDPMGNAASSTSATSATSTATTTSSYDLAGDSLSSTTTGSASSAPTTGTSSAYAPDGAVCWSSPLPYSGSGTPSCANPPLGSTAQTTLNYYDQDGHLVAVWARVQPLRRQQHQWVQSAHDVNLHVDDLLRL
jgi:hypothetical protein